MATQVHLVVLDLFVFGSIGWSPRHSYTSTHGQVTFAYSLLLDLSVAYPALAWNKQLHLLHMPSNAHERGCWANISAYRKGEHGNICLCRLERSCVSRACMICVVFMCGRYGASMKLTDFANAGVRATKRGTKENNLTLLDSDWSGLQRCGRCVSLT